MITVDGHSVKFETYPNGEVIVPKIPCGLTSFRSVRFHWENDGDFVKLALVAGYLHQNHCHPHLTIEYMPYSRMDREQDGHCFSLKYVSELINAMGFETVLVVEPHSEATTNALHRAQPFWATAKLVPDAMKSMAFDKQHDYLVLPDAGAFKRYSEQVPELNECNVVVLKKKRDFSTGKILGIEIDYKIIRHKQDGEPVRALIIDDLSSRGGTFVGAADLLRDECDCNYVALLVTHMEPAGLLGELRYTLDKVFCSDTMSFPRPVPPNFNILPTKDWL